MSNRTTHRDRALNIFDEKREWFSLSTIHNWLLVFACVMIFFVLPLLFVWSSSGMIHLQISEQQNHGENTILQHDQAVNID